MDAFLYAIPEKQQNYLQTLMKRSIQMKKLIAIILVCAILPRVITINFTVNNHINVRHKHDKLKLMNNE